MIQTQKAHSLSSYGLLTFLNCKSRDITHIDDPTWLLNKNERASLIDLLRSFTDKSNMVIPTATELADRPGAVSGGYLSEPGAALSKRVVMPKVIIYVNRPPCRLRHHRKDVNAPHHSPLPEGEEIYRVDKDTPFFVWFIKLQLSCSS